MSSNNSSKSDYSRRPSPSKRSQKPTASQSSKGSSDNNPNPSYIPPASVKKQK
ncbi:hypothetical protein [Subdoligranulum variabile]|uniref:Uncharacterized protein n=1 Tax=Subdoligranulum variabile DSM 15176 TaxID=411471 RepID=D1PQA0_9FIRM|nr:hypothetical protein [Subdoligranulum variabile]EFB75153.1 hypothetical protein SUBVAR_06568 [Subdoligranulum variabile DSM 15176]UWP66913.1 hypothetical protein NQ490_08125 [Subdoligranulum variabile]